MKRTIQLLTIFLITTHFYAQCYEQFAAGSDHIIALKTDKTLWGFGRANAGQLTTQNNSHQLTPLQISSLTDWYSIWAGGLNTFAIKNNGTLWATGANNSGSLGKGTTGVQYSFTQIGLATNWKKLATNGQHTIGIRTDGTLWGWGQNDASQLGQGSPTPSEYSPIQIGTTIGWVDIAVTSLAKASVAIKNDGTIWGCGTGNNILFGLVGTNSPTLTQIGTDTNWQKVHAGNGFIIAQKTDGTLWIWGTGGNGEIGNITDIATTPYQLTTDTWKDFTAGSQRNYGIKTNGTLWAWGRNTEGQLGDGTFVNKNVPTQIGTATDWDRIYASGNTTTLGVKTDGTVWVWGSNNYGQFGNGNALNVGSNVPLQNTLLCATLGVDGFTKTNFKVYPNPASDQVQISYDTNSEATIELYDMQGKLLKTMQTVGLQGTVSIPLNNLSRGLYLVKFVTNDGVKQVEKLVVE
jgi:alpha-tubulin suppressor-like RCC1 family protein